MFELNGRVSIVTGGSSGIGRAIAQLFAERGAKVVIADTNENGGDETCETIARRGGHSFYVYADVSRVSNLRNMIRTAIDKYGKVDILVNNAGVSYFDGFRLLPEEKFRKAVDINLKSVYYASELARRIMRKGGVIINISSANAIRASPKGMVYSSTKGGVSAITVAMAIKYARYNIRVNCILPGPTKTAINKKWPQMKKDPKGTLAEMARMTLLNRVGDPIDVAYGALYLASEEASFVTGTALVIDGGYLLK